jgi:adenylate kinase
VKTILVSGTPGTGKSFLAKKLSLLLDYTYFDVNLFIKTAHIYDKFDRKRAAFVVDVDKLVPMLLKVREKALKGGQKGIIFDSHLAHFLPSSRADLCIVAHCSLKVLKARLSKRGYSASKVRENLDAEIFDTCASEAKEAGHCILSFDTTTANGAKIKAFSRKIIKLVAGPHPVRT